MFNLQGIKLNLSQTNLISSLYIELKRHDRRAARSGMVVTRGLLDGMGGGLARAHRVTKLWRPTVHSPDCSGW